MNRHNQKRISHVSKSGRGTRSGAWRHSLAFETLETRDLLNAEWDGCVVETGADGKHFISGSCPALESGGGDNSGSSGNSSGGSDNAGWPLGTDEFGSESALGSDFFDNSPATDNSGSGDCSMPLPDGTYPHYCLHEGQIVYTGDYQDNDVDVDGHCAEPLADGTTPHSCFHDGQIVYPGDYQDSNEYPSNDALSEAGRTDPQSLQDSEYDMDEYGTDFSGQFVGIASEGIGLQDGPGFGSTTPPEESTEDWANPWYNEEMPTDTNGDGQTSPQDALLLINELNSYGSRRLVASSQATGQGEGESAATRFLDVNKDQWLSPADVLAVINQLNSVSSLITHGEGEAIVPSAVNAHSVITSPTLPSTRSRATDTEYPPSLELNQSSIAEPNDSRDLTPSIRQSIEQIEEIAWEEVGRMTNLPAELDETLISILANESGRGH